MATEETSMSQRLSLGLQYSVVDVLILSFQNAILLYYGDLASKKVGWAYEDLAM